MKTLPNDNITPIMCDRGTQIIGGLTKREHFAAMAMQGMLHNGCITEHGVISQAPETIAMQAVIQADALIKYLNKDSLQQQSDKTELK